VGLLPTRLPTYEVAGHTLYNWDRNASPWMELNAQRIYRFFEMHGFHLTHPGSIDEERLQYYLIGMESWPQNGYIRETEYYVIIKLGESLLE
jgi:hypothetical protein